MIPFYILLHDVNSRHSEKYDIMPYFVDTYTECLERKWWWPMEDPKKQPEAIEDIKQFIIRSGKHQFRSRCQYEYLMLSWPPGRMDTLEDCQNLINHAEKIDGWEQIEMNFDIILKIFVKNIEKFLIH